MQPTLKILSDAPILTDYSFVEFRATTDLYEMLLSDQSEPLDMSLGESSGERQLTPEESVYEKTMGQIGDTQEVEPKQVSYRCNCTKSRCSKNYCECFRAGRQCSSECSCSNCDNLHEHEAKPVRGKQQRGGCNCRKTHCQKKYCECHSRGVKCTSRCNCIGCENVGGQGDCPQENPFTVIDTFYL